MLVCFRRNAKKISKITIEKEFLEKPPRPEKLIIKTADFLDGGKLEPILVDKDYNLIDGYCSYLIATALQSDKVKIIQIKNKRGKENE